MQSLYDRTKNKTGTFEEEYREVVETIEEHDELTEKAPKPNVLVIVEAPNAEQASIVEGIYLDSIAYFSRLPKKGDRLILNGMDDDDSNITGSADEVLKGVHPFADGTTWRVWVTLDRPEDYASLSKVDGWYIGADNKRRTTSPPIDLAEKAASSAT